MTSVMTSVMASWLWLATAASADQPLPDVKPAVNQIVGACAMGPTNSFKEALSSNLADFLRQGIETKSAKSVKLNELLGRIPTDTEEARGQLKSERARKMFFTIYFDCIRHQVSLKLKSFGVAYE